MAKIHTRAKRLLGITSTQRKHRFYFTSVTAKKGHKSFDTKEKAMEWAKQNSVDMKTHEVHTLRTKFQVRPIPRQ
jgi:hypothetical protein